MWVSESMCNWVNVKVDDDDDVRKQMLIITNYNFTHKHTHTVITSLLKAARQGQGKWNPQSKPQTASQTFH